MPPITAQKIGISLDIRGCPNKCRHCYLGFGTNRAMSDADLRWMASQFRSYIETADTPIKSLDISSTLREPDFSDEYRHLYELEKELSRGNPVRYELLSIWRLAHDKDYTAWAKSVGPQTCQITFFGTEKTTDWFYRRKGAFKDALTATERLLEVGMKPRWQLVLTKKLIPEIDELLQLAERLRLRERVQELGSEFQLFMHTPNPLQEGRKIEHLRPTLEEVTWLPEEILEPSRRHLGTQTLWQTEGELYKSIIESEQPLITPSQVWFFVTNNWDVFSNAGTLEPWWKLGNLKNDSVETILRRFENDEILGLQILLHYPQRKLAEEYGDPHSNKIYGGRTDLIDLYHGQHCEKIWRSRTRA